jgi:threonine/homoserine/homoserine lactone efflux protein
MSPFLRAVVIGFSIAAPVGPIGVLCIRRSLTRGARAGFVSGLGAASADAVYGSLAAFGLTAISQWLVDQQGPIRLVGGLFLCVLGLRALFAQPIETFGDHGVSEPSGLPAAYVSTFALTITNPMTIVSFAAVFAGLGLDVGQDGFSSALTLVLGVFGGSALWWLTLSGVSGLLRHRLGSNALRWINRISGAIIAAFGLSVLVTLL